MRVLITGATGMIGSALRVLLLERGVETATLSRTPPSSPDPSRLFWNPSAAVLNPEHLEGIDAVVHLAGENIAAGRWTRERKTRIFESRVRGTSLLSTALAACVVPPKTVISASAVGYYGDCGDTILDENAPPGSGFLAETCCAWEAAAQPLIDAGIRTVFLRTGMVLSRSGGALERMLLPFRLGLGGPFGLGRRWMSWIALDDIVRMIAHCLEEVSLSGPVNAVAPHPVRNRAFVRTLGRQLRRPALLPIPPVALRLIMGEMAQELLLSSTRAVPRRLEETGFIWNHPQLDGAVDSCLHEVP